MTGKKEENNKGDSNGGSSHIHIPMDLTVEIITRLPVESLLKLQYVSRTWFSIIRSKDFINSSVYMSSTPSSKLLISFINGDLSTTNPKKSLFFFTASQEEDKSSSLVAKLDMTMASPDANFYTRCVSLNGFICLSHKDRLMICNPSTRQVITLPEIPGTKWNSTYKCLGYDPVDDQYKLLCTRHSDSGDDQEYMVLTLGGNEKLSWRRIEGTTQNYYPKTNELCIDGFVYYGAWTSLKVSVIVCFDVRSERLSFIEAPFQSIEDSWESTLINYKGKLAILYLCRRISEIVGDSYGFTFWILEDVKEHIWSIRFTIMFSELTHRNEVWWDSFVRAPLSIQGTNKTGEIVISPKFLPRDRNFYIFYFKVEFLLSYRIRMVQIEGVADFRTRYGIGGDDECEVYISPDYGGNIVFL